MGEIGRDAALSEADKVFTLGQRVTAPGRIIRSSDGDKRYWHRPKWLKSAVHGVYMGRRTYRNGLVLWGGGDEEGNYFKYESAVKVALIVTDPRHKPIPVLFDEMKAESEA